MLDFFRQKRFHLLLLVVLFMLIAGPSISWTPSRGGSYACPELVLSKVEGRSRRAADSRTWEPTPLQNRDSVSLATCSPSSPLPTLVEQPTKTPTATPTPEPPTPTPTPTSTPEPPTATPVPTSTPEPPTPTPTPTSTPEPPTPTPVPTSTPTSAPSVVIPAEWFPPAGKASILVVNEANDVLVFTMGNQEHRLAAHTRKVVFYDPGTHGYTADDPRFEPYHSECTLEAGVIYYWYTDDNIVSELCVQIWP